MVTAARPVIPLRQHTSEEAGFALSSAELDRLVAALDNAGPAVAVGPAELLRSLSFSEAPACPSTAVVVATSGSTGVPKLVELSAAALTASADATAARLGGEGNWLLALPPHYIAGLQVVLRALAAGHLPTVLPAGRFSATTFAEAARSMSGDRTYVSLVPTQLSRLLASADREVLAAARRFDAILVGGAAFTPGLRSRAEEAELPIVATYGMSETCGGCVYDGAALPGVEVRVDTEGRVHLSGPMLATGYMADDEATRNSFGTDPTGARWFRTSDLGEMNDGRLTILGRIDEVIITGGVKVPPAAVEDILVDELDAEEAIVFAVPDPHWGHSVGAVIVPSPRTSGSLQPRLTQALDAVRQVLGRAAVPLHLAVCESSTVPRLPTGKTDRARVRETYASRWATKEA